MVSDEQDKDDAYWMVRACEVASESLYLTAPNPRVGCVIVHQGHVLGQGATQRAGSAHAEVMALRDATARGHDKRLSEATVYVTLEPCSHYGRTAPCVDALIKHRPAAVVVALSDPNPQVSGQGIARLRQAGITVRTISAESVKAKALALNPGFVSRMAFGRPWLRSKIATSLDGQMALRNSESQWVTGSEARADGHHWRARSCIVLTGIGTVQADDPLLNVRSVQTPRQPIRAVLDRGFEVSPSAQLFNGDPVWVFCEDRPLTAAERDKKARLEALQVTVVPMPLAPTGRHLDLNEVLHYMAQHEINEVHLEAGPRLNGAVLEAKILDELLHYMAPKVIGPGQAAFAISELSSLQQAPQLRFAQTQRLGDDVLLRAFNEVRWQALMAQV